MARFDALVVVTVLVKFACGAQTQMNLVTPWDGGPFWQGITTKTDASFGKFGNFDSWPLYDGNLDTVVTVDTDQRFYSTSLSYHFQVKVLRYRIYAGKGTDLSWFPRAWKLTAYTGVERKVLDTVTNAHFVDGVFTGKFKNPGKHRSFEIKFTEDSTPNDNMLRIKMGEIKYFGPRSQYDRQVDGQFPCKNAPVYVLRKDGKTRALGGVPFSSDSTLSPGDLSSLFNDKWFSDGPSRVYLQRGKLIIGYHFPKALTVVQFGLKQNFLWSPLRMLEGALKLEGHKCDPTCDYLGRDGWVSLSRGTPKRQYDRKFLVQRPGSYRAYRVRIDIGSGEGYTGAPGYLANMQEITFLQCAEGDEI